MSLTGKQRKALRALAHHLNPIVQVGHEGVTESVLLQVDQALSAHELIKVKLGAECPVDRDAAAAAIAEGTRSEIPQVIGRIVVVYRRRPRKPKVDIPTKKGDERKARPKGSKGKKPRKRAAPKGARTPRKLRPMR